ncbi:transferase [candidate division KSB1 bacterium]|nr:transferase [candidate division KSB1 bacterium]NIR72485.1 transferase [candidate division KSB1 bacterium]NIS24070.1 transferase [candidate division KSB1 bacterium]NIT70989.1 transferase [candidate division KSB1 bacterium]NIU27400.1 transferase [candidate division KSB1 bacterium]
MSAICIFEDRSYSQLHPLSLTRPVFELRCGLTSLREKIRRQFPDRALHFMCRDYLVETVQETQSVANVNDLTSGECLFINGHLLADSRLPKALSTESERLYLHQGQLVAAFLNGSNIEKMQRSYKGLDLSKFDDVPKVEIEAQIIEYPWDLVNLNAQEIQKDFAYLKQGGQIQGKVYDQATLLNKDEIYVGKNSVIKPGAVLDAEAGPIYVGENVTIMPNAVIEGPVFIGDNSIIKIGAKIYEGTSIGEWCKVGGEVEESIVHSHTNKQHDGFLGHAYLGQWVNLGADTNNSDLKNNYHPVKVPINGQMVDSGSMFVGLFMGDHSKAGINTMFNTGTVVGPMSNVFGGGFPPKFIPSFAWGGKDGFVEHNLEKALETARRVMARRNIDMSPAYETLFRHVFELTQNERTWA